MHGLKISSHRVNGMGRLPSYSTEEDFQSAVANASRKELGVLPWVSNRLFLDLLQ